ncbi:lysylphosphatidylglycerol synthase transmembrane domain-containing protein [Afifella pfennigii]|uniref:lysylphosphatidylglycerol synthase transmembrane domain-containing protein n=1 Tax=Afifella pfennigii TaxID=209897 RepID=UPI00047E76AD|nr:lysylphosphatidylglycerol synthase transmembrane domain-containing protein [Afifella pfennigii]
MRSAEHTQRRRWWQRFPYRLIGVGLLIYILSVVDLREVAAALAGLSIGELSLASLIIAAFIGLRCARWDMLVRSTGCNLPFITNLHSCSEAIWLGLVTPGRLGEFRRAMEVRRASGRRLVVIGWLVTFDLALDLAAMALFFLAGLPILFLSAENSLGPLLYAGIFLSGSLALIFTPAILLFAHDYLPGLRQLPGLTEFVKDMLTRLGGRGMASLTLLSISAFLGYAGAIWALTANIDLDLSLLALLTMVGAVGVSGAIPITVFGLGTRELVLIWYLGFFGKAAETAIAVSLMFLAAQAIAFVISFLTARATKLFLPQTDEPPDRNAAGHRQD